MAIDTITLLAIAVNARIERQAIIFKSFSMTSYITSSQHNS